MRTIAAVGLLILLAGCAHEPPPAPPLPKLPPATKPVARPAHPAAKPSTAPTAPLPASRPEQSDDPTPAHICNDLAKRRAEDAATLGVDAKKQHDIEKSVYASCIGPAQKPAP